MTAVDLSKRALLFGRPNRSLGTDQSLRADQSLRTDQSPCADSAPSKAASPLPIRPPWALAEPAFLDACTACGDCVQACPEQILVRGGGRYPEVDFTRGSCTFCGGCADACGQAVFQTERQVPWTYAAVIADHCLLKQQVICQSCGDACEAEAIRFRPQLGGGLHIEIQTELCTGCGACVSPCPTAAIELKTPEATA